MYKMSLLEIMKAILPMIEDEERSFICGAFQSITGLTCEAEDVIKRRYPQYYKWIVYHARKSWKMTGGDISEIGWGNSWQYGKNKKVKLIKRFIKRLEFETEEK